MVRNLVSIITYYKAPPIVTSINLQIFKSFSLRNTKEKRTQYFNDFSLFFRWVVGIWLVMKLTSDDLLDR